MKDLIINVVYRSIEEVNSFLENKISLEEGLITPLFGKKGQLDSLGLVNLIVVVEQNIEDEFDVNISLADERALSQKRSPFRTIGSLADYIGIILEEETNE